MTESRRQRGASGTRERLADISRYFLSDPETAVSTPPAGSTETCLLPVLVSSEVTQALVYALARALHARGVTAIVLHVDSRLRVADPRSSSLCSQPDTPAGLRMRLKDGLGGTKPQPRVCLIPVTDPEDTHLREYKRVLIAVGATPTGLKQSYLSVKQFALAGAESRISAIVVGTANKNDGRKLFDRLAAATMRFLGRTLDYAGTVTTTTADSTSDGPATGLPDLLNDVVVALLRDGLLDIDAGNTGAPSGDQGSLT